MLLVFSLVSALFYGCEGNDHSNTVSLNPIAGDRLYIPSGYKDELKAKQLKEVEAFPYFKSPFIAIAENTSGNQIAVIFRDSGEISEVPLLVKYNEIVNVVKSRGIHILLPSTSPSDTFKNLKILEINKKLVWSYDDGTNKLYLDLEGNEMNNPFH